ncbi:TonB-dependent siderophore receptor [Achromobacter pulmonis]|uniref:TonB-dependent siderophore receptor n=1 Tax=Achromobacter pulmonis TaxID=1389932 RepID=UPI001583F70B|nr:TonB-dependent siderophore receptor [Achromobacter pulmonis]
MLAWAQPGAALAAEAAEAPTLPSIEVVGSVEDDGFVPRRASSATRSDLPLGQIAQSVSVVTRAQMDAQDARSINEAFRYAPGIATEQWGGVTAFDQLTIRGFTGGNGSADTFLDGLRQTGGVVYGAQQVDPFLLERMEVLRGPASVLYGMATPGGVLALTSKLPRDETIRLVELEGGTRGYRRGSFDLGGRADRDGAWLYRIAGTVWNSDGKVDGFPARRRAVAPSLVWQPSAATRLTLYARYQDDPSLGSLGSVPVAGSVLPNPNGRVPRYTNIGEPSYDAFSRKQRVAGFRVDQRLAGGWWVTSSGRYSGISMHRDVVIGHGLQPDLRTLNRNTSLSEETYHAITLDNQVKGRFTSGPLQHDLLAGISWEQMRGRGDYSQGAASPLDLYQPVHGALVTGAPMMYTNNRVRSTQTGLYLQDQLALGNWTATLGVRHDWSTIDTIDLLGRGGFKQHDEATTVRVGSLYHFQNGLAPYVTYAQSFQPTNQLSSSGKPFKPSRGELIEAGLKYQPYHWDALLTVAVFNLTQSDLLTADPANVAFSIQGGELRSRGLELEARAKLGAQWSVIAAYTWQNVEYTKGNPANIGKTPPRVPERFGGVWLAWDAPSGLGAALGVRHNGGTWVGDGRLEQYRTAAFTLVDAQLHYDLGRQVPSLKGARVQLNVTNLTDKRHIASCYDETMGGCFPGAGRVVNLKVAYQW